MAERESPYCAPAFAAVSAFVSIVSAGMGVTFTVAEACRLFPFAPAAVTVTLVSVFTSGAVKRPLLEIVPAVAVQTTAVSLVPVMLAVNCSFASEATVALLGEIAR